MTARWGGAPDRFGRRPKPAPESLVTALCRDFFAAAFGGGDRHAESLSGLVVAVGRPRTPGRLPVSSAATGRATRGRML
jgi:hypothetical protein